VKGSRQSTNHRWYAEEPKGHTYAALLTSAVGFARIASVVVSTSRGDSAALPPALKSRPFENRRELNRFGTAGMAQTAEFKYDKACARALAEAAKGWFEWQMPYLPADLALYGDDGLVIGAVAHEAMFWIECTTKHFTDVFKQVPGLRILEGPGYRGRS
jgi:hypothetical protein